MKKEDKILYFPHRKPDAQEVVLDGKPELMFTACGVMLLCFFAWRDDGNQKAHDGLRRYCKYLAAHGCPGGASGLLEELKALDDEAAKAWIRRTFDRYVQDGPALVEYALGAPVV